MKTPNCLKRLVLHNTHTTFHKNGNYVYFVESESAATATCEVDGTSYKEGERFYPKNACTVCVCQKGFNGTLSAPFCQKQICGVQLSKSEELEKYCAPIYYNRKDDTTKLCCPDSYICRK